MSELGGLNEPTSDDNKSSLDSDDFFSNLEAELSQSLGDSFIGKSNKSVEQEESNINDDSPEPANEALETDFFSSLLDDLGDDLADELEKKSDLVLKDDTSAATNQNDLIALTVRELKDLLRT